MKRPSTGSGRTYAIAEQNLRKHALSGSDGFARQPTVSYRAKTAESAMTSRR